MASFLAEMFAIEAVAKGAEKINNEIKFENFIGQGKEIKILKLNADNDNLVSILRGFSVNSIPTFIVLDNGVVVDKIIGAIPKHKFIDFMAKNFN
jgi:thiol-disulfide isomerase/thioredoxin